ncbi:hypothetical protein M3Y99_00421900 [Aphelenchoides fujianensis]|nr:hypothetical protein M3Y99_00421900 [Aphelenchoides fujianensis]
MQYIHTSDNSNQTELIAMEGVNPLEGLMFIPFVIFVFGAPGLFIGFLCYIQKRNRRMNQQATERATLRRLATPAHHLSGGRAHRGHVTV